MIDLSKCAGSESLRKLRALAEASKGYGWPDDKVFRDAVLGFASPEALIALLDHIKALEAVHDSMLPLGPGSLKGWPEMTKAVHEATKTRKVLEELP